MIVDRIGVLGNGGQADEVESFLSDDQEIVFRAVSKEYLSSDNLQLVDIEDTDHIDIPVIAAIGAPYLRKKMIELWKGAKYATIIHKTANINKDTRVGEGTVIAPGVIVTTNVNIGNHVIVNIGVNISHDSVIADFVTISPGAMIAGKVDIGRGVFIGIGASISNGVKIAEGSVVGAGAVVIKDIEEKNSVVVGNPSRLIRINESWLSEI